MAITIAYHSGILRSSDEIMTTCWENTRCQAIAIRIATTSCQGASPGDWLRTGAKHSAFGEMTLGQLTSKGVSIHLLQSAWTTWDVHFDAD